MPSSPDYTTCTPKQRRRTMCCGCPWTPRRRSKSACFPVRATTGARSRRWTTTSSRRRRYPPSASCCRATRICSCTWHAPASPVISWSMCWSIGGKGCAGGSLRSTRCCSTKTTDRRTTAGRTQFLKRIVAFGQRQQLTIRLAYYPPYHSKYNPIERCWNGVLLESIPTALRFAQTMTWHGKHPFVQLIDKIYQRGVKLTAAEMKELETQVQRLPGLEKWFVDIPPRVSLG